MLETLVFPMLGHLKSLLLFGVFFLLLEFGFPAHKDQKIWRKDSHLDLVFSCLLLLLFLPIGGLVTAGLNNYFHGAIGSGVSKTQNKITVSLEDTPAKGTVVIHSDGSFQYQPADGFTGMDAFSVKKSDGENTLTLSFLAKVEPLQKATARSQVSLAMTASIPGGKITEGIPGLFLKMRNIIQQQSLYVQIFLAVFLVDFLGYWRHRLMHSGYLWPFHTIHHSSKQIDWLSTERVHPVDHYIIVFLNMTLLTALFADPYVASTEMLLRRGYGLFIHSNVRISYGILDYVFSGPLFHRWHHSDSEWMKKKNYATFFSLFDLIFGTFYLPKEKQDPKTFGFYGGELTKGLVGQTIYPFVKLAGYLPF